jgi:hypothetical protein
MTDIDDSERGLTSALRRLAQDDAARAASAVPRAVEARLRAEVRALGAVRRARVRWNIGLAAVVVASTAISVWRFASRPPDTDSALTQSVASGAGPARREITTAFLPLVYNDVPAAGAQIVRLSVPRSALASFGLTPPDSVSAQDSAGGASPTVVADVLVGDDGLARAVRFVRAAAPTGSSGLKEQTR